MLDGDGGEQDYDSEGGDDIMLAGPGIQRSEGMQGFDWVTHKNDPLPPTPTWTSPGSCLRVSRPTATGSTWSRRCPAGPATTSSAATTGVAADLGVEHTLNPAGIDRITGLRALLPARTTSFNAGNIIGGAGSDTIEGRGGDDIINGDAWLNTRLSVRSETTSPPRSARPRA